MAIPTKGAVRSARWRAAHPDLAKQYGRDWAKAAHRRRRDQILEALGSKCACCGEATREFLAIDHINGDGAAHRQQFKSGSSVYLDILRRGCPKDEFRLLCHNCNQARSWYGRCPHEAR